MSERIERADSFLFISSVSHEYAFSVCDIESGMSAFGHRLLHIVVVIRRIILRPCLDADRETSGRRYFASKHTRNGKSALLSRIPAHENCRHLVVPTAHIHGSTGIYHHDHIVVVLCSELDEFVLSLRKSEGPVMVFLLSLSVETHRNDHGISLFQCTGSLPVVFTHESHREILSQLIHALVKGNRIERVHRSAAASARNDVGTRAHQSHSATLFKRKSVFILEKYSRLA